MDAAIGAAANERHEMNSIEIGCNNAQAFHVGNEAYTVEISIGGGKFAYHVGPGAFPYFTKEQA